ncbi:MAG TPA: DUF6452 family protein [Bacteroidales bacterium]|nr:DUF6452 family protein [Bacteroidales bacterium]
MAGKVIACHFYLILPLMKPVLHSKLSLLRLIPFIILMVFVSCLPGEGCEEAATNPMRIGFYLPVAGTDRFSPVSLDSLTMYGVNRPDSLLYNNRKGVRNIEAPLNPASDSTGFVVIFPGNVIDTLWVFYNRQPFLISAECGFTMYYEIEQFLHTSRRINSFQIIQPLVRNTLEEHIRIILDNDPGS